MAQKKTILIIDDHPLFREGLKAIIGRNHRFEVVGHGLQKAKELKPDLALVDMSLPDQSGIQLTREIKNALPKTRIMIITMHSKVDYIVKAFQAGATGYVIKESTSERLLQGIDTVLKGEYFMDSSVSHRVVEKLMEFPEKEMKMTDASYDTLTRREQEIMVLLAQGLSNKQIAEKLFISPKTVENHRSNILRKLNIHSTIELVRYAARLGIIDVDLWKG
ncbi:MAG: response regulator transcription factor [Deltaproteobacteria bacterium]|nr:response regulator transcription factor [Deltaproteobacteria bacterium]